MTTLTSLLAKIDDAQVKTAADTAQPPQEGHPTDHIDDHVAVPTGDTVTTAADDQVDRLGNLAAGSSSPATNDKEKIIPTMQTQVLDGTTSPAELTPGEGLEDPGPDSSHPASPTKNEKYASMRTAQEVLAEMNKVANFTRGQLSAANGNAKKASAEAPKTPAAPQAPAEGVNKFAAALNDLIVPEKREAAIKSAAHVLEPLVAFGVGMANKVANFMAAAEQDPAAAAAMMGSPDGGMGGGAPPMDPAAGGGAPPMDPAAGAAGGGGGDPIQALVQQIEAVAQQLGVDPSELMMALAGQGGGAPAGGGGDPAAAGGGAPPMAGGGDGGAPSAAPTDSAPKDSSSSEGGSPAKSDEKEEGDEESKEAGAPSKIAKSRKTARLRQQVSELLDELDC